MDVGMLENQMVSQIILFLCSVAIVYIVSYAYLSGILAFARKGFKYEVLIVLGIPILLIPFIDYADFYTRRLIVLETVLIYLSCYCCFHIKSIWVRMLKGV
ncbi:hypothetical protein AC626_01980 [Pseudoalteromonas rubra]|uniref:Uncharacterized protein n=1 Tax=Pseudoalteromonas rubra TaxID=43658 RepID=A0A0L0EWU8_9GAMM|nr:hypothetical protein AC626_01980 [Pseudoalteromonas rubra]